MSFMTRKRPGKPGATTTTFADILSERDKPEGYVVVFDTVRVVRGMPNTRYLSMQHEIRDCTKPLKLKAIETKRRYRSYGGWQFRARF